MRTALEITFRGLKKTPDMEKLIQEKTEKLEQVCRALVRCRVTVEVPQKHQQSGNPFRVRIQMTLPEKELVVKRDSGKGEMHDQLPKVLRDAYAAARRALVNTEELHRGKNKVHPEHTATAHVVRLFDYEGYGFLKDATGVREIYFHQNSVLNQDFHRLEIGTEVRFTESRGDEGPQASSVEIVDKAAPRTGGGQGTTPV